MPVFQHDFLRSEENVDLHNLSVAVRENVNLHKFQSHHTIAAKYSVVNTLHHRARAVCSNPPATKEGKRTSTEGPNGKQSPCMGSEQG